MTYAQPSLFDSTQDYSPIKYRWENNFIAFDKLDYADYKRKMLVQRSLLTIEWAAEYNTVNCTGVFQCYGCEVLMLYLTVEDFEDLVLKIKNNPAFFADYANTII